jgi:hypothetical protein
MLFRLIVPPAWTEMGKYLHCTHTRRIKSLQDTSSNCRCIYKFLTPAGLYTFHNGHEVDLRVQMVIVLDIEPMVSGFKPGRVQRIFNVGNNS